MKSVVNGVVFEFQFKFTQWLNAGEGNGTLCSLIDAIGDSACERMQVLQETLLRQQYTCTILPCAEDEQAMDKKVLKVTPASRVWPSLQSPSLLTSKQFIIHPRS